MGTWTSSLASIVDALAKRNGGRYDEKTPKMRASDMVAVLGLYSSQLPSAIKRIAPIVTLAGFVGQDGVLQVSLALAPRITPEAYVFHSVPSGSIAWRRSPTVATGPLNVYEFAREHSLAQDDKTEYLTYLRQMIDDYQAGVDQITNAITMYPISIASDSICRSFMSAIRRLAVDLEVLAENPPTTFAQDARAALGVALEASKEATVQLAEKGAAAAAWVGNAAGEIAGAAASGFLNTANIVTILVGYVVLRRYI